MNSFIAQGITLMYGAAAIAALSHSAFAEVPREAANVPLQPTDGLLTKGSGRLRTASLFALSVLIAGGGVWLRRGLVLRRKREESSHAQELARTREDGERYVENIVDSLRRPLLLIGAGLTIERANRAYRESFEDGADGLEGCPLKEATGGLWKDPRLCEMVAAVLAGGPGFDHFECELPWPGKGRRTFLIDGHKLPQPAGTGDAVLLLFEETTQRRQVEEERRARDERFRMMVDAVDGYAFFLLDAEGRVASWNRGAERLKAYHSEEILGAHLSRFYPPEDVTAGKPERLLNEAREKGYAEDEGWRVRKDGARFFAHVTLSAIRDDAGRLTGFAKVTRDISERHRMAEMHVHFQALFCSLPGLYLVLSPDFKIVAVSDAYLKATMSDRENILGMEFFEAFPENPDDPRATGAENMRASLQRVLKTGKADSMAIQRYDVKGARGAFEERYWSPINSPVAGKDGGIEYIIHRLEDATEFVKRKPRAGDSDGELQGRLERMEMEIFRSMQDVQAANQQLREANSELEAFSYSVSHDLRAPLRHIDGFAALLTAHADTALDAKGRRYLQTISKCAKRMGALIDDLLVFARIGRAELRHTEVDLGAIADEVIQELRVETEGRNVVWNRRTLPAAPGDASLLRQVWVNLLSNALKYTRHQDPAIIEINSTPCLEERIFFVRDNGVGFDMAYVDKLFGVFQRLHRHEEFEGTGIGLANVRRIIARHGGRTWAEGKLGEGATFYFSLPMTTPNLGGAPSPAHAFA